MVSPISLLRVLHLANLSDDAETRPRNPVATLAGRLFLLVHFAAEARAR